MHRFLHILPILRSPVLQLPLTQRNLVLVTVLPRVYSCIYCEDKFSVCAALLHVDSLEVSDITNVSAKFEWTHIAKNNIHHIKFKVSRKSLGSNP